MIQRIQSVWLLLAAAFSILTFKFPFYTGTRVLESLGSSVGQELDAASHLGILIATVAVIALSVVSIFLYKNRKKQMLLCILDLIISLGIIALYFMQISSFDSGSMALYCVFAFAVPICIALAIAGIRKDSKLIKSLDRLR